MTIDDKITVFNAHIESFVDRTFFWTAITRATELKNVTVFIHDEKMVTKMFDSRIKQYFKFKVNSYKKQDNDAGREFKKEEFVDVDWIAEKYKINKFCNYCTRPYDFDIDNTNVTSTLTVDRIDNARPHTKNNCILCCTSCNVAKGNH